MLPQAGKRESQSFSATNFAADIYGYRGTDPRVYYLSPWEFCMYWHTERLLPPSKHHEELTAWCTEVDEDGRTPQDRVREGNADGSPYEPIPGRDYVVNEALLCGPEAPGGQDAWLVSQTVEQTSRSCTGSDMSG